MMAENPQPTGAIYLDDSNSARTVEKVVFFAACGLLGLGFGLGFCIASEKGIGHTTADVPAGHIGSDKQPKADSYDK
jgi:hypothetical protein